MRLSDERLALLGRHRSLALAEDVRALVAEVRALRECEKALRDLRECSNPFLAFGEREVHRRRVAADRAIERLEVLGASTQTES